MVDDRAMEKPCVYEMVSMRGSLLTFYVTSHWVMAHEVMGLARGPSVVASLRANKAHVSLLLKSTHRNEYLVVAAQTQHGAQRVSHLVGHRQKNSRPACLCLSLRR